MKRIVLWNSDTLQIVFFFWRKGDKTKIHDHGESEVICYPLFGYLEESKFEEVKLSEDVSELVLKKLDRVLWGSKDSDHIHRVSCRSRFAISLNVASSPLKMKVYELKDDGSYDILPADEA